MSNTLNLGDGKWATKEGSLLAYNSENNNYKPLPFTFDRDTIATRVNKDGLIETVGADQPRIDYLNDSNGALLLEPARTNYLLQSNQFDTTWTNTNTTVTSGQVGVGGSSDAWKVDISSAFAQVEQTVSNNGVQTFSVYAKAGTLNWIRLRVDHTSFSGTYFDLQNGQVGSTVGTDSTSIENLGNGWYRCTIVVDDNVTRARIYPASANNDLSATSGNIYIQNSQLEQGSFATSIINTKGSAVTRAADSCSQTVPDNVIGQTEGTMFFDIDFSDADGVQGAWSISDNSSSNRITMNTIDVSSTLFTLSIAQNYNSGSTKLASANVTFSDKHKVAIKYSGTTLKLFVDGQLSDSVSTDGFGNYTHFYLGNNQVGSSDGDTRKFKDVRLYNTALTDQELIALTT